MAGRKQLPPSVHGTTRKYQEGCHCELCRAAWATKQREYKARKRAAAAVPDAPVTDIGTKRKSNVPNKPVGVEAEFMAARDAATDPMVKITLSIGARLARAFENDDTPPGALSAMATQLRDIVKESQAQSAVKGRNSGAGPDRLAGILGSR